jgi:hypothetical protein
MALSRLLQIKAACNASGCSKYFEAQACTENFLSLLEFKYQSALQTLLMMLTGMYTSWNGPLESLNAMLIIPLVGIATALWLSDGLLQVRNSNILMCLVLIVVAFPYRPEAARTKKYRTHTLQSLVLRTLFALQTIDLVKGLYLLVTDKAAAVQTILQTNEPSSSRFLCLVYFFLVDRLTQATVYLFSWYSLQESQQRSLLLILGGIHAMSYYNDQSSVLTLTLAIACLGAWAAPTVRWKSKLN